MDSVVLKQPSRETVMTPPPPRVVLTEKGAQPDHSNGLDKEAWGNTMVTLFQTRHLPSIYSELDDVRAALGMSVSKPDELELYLNRYLALLASLQPGDGLERSLIACDFIAHVHAVRALAKASTSTSFDVRQAESASAARFMRVQAQLAAAIRNYRNEMPSRVIFNHVVAEQAVVGDVHRSR